MIYSVELSQFAIDDLVEIVDWYRDQRDGLDKEFTLAFEVVLRQIEINPLAFQVKFKQSRNVTMQRFPYKVVFKVFDNKIRVVGVIHHARNPRLIRKRLK